MRIDNEYKDNIVILRINGEIDMANADTFITKVNEFKEKDCKLIFDFSRVNFIDSTGIGILIKFLKEHEDLEYAITNLQEDIEDIFEILNLKEILGENRFIDSYQEAVKILQDIKK